MYTHDTQRVSAGKGGAVSTAHPGATQAGVEILEDGGNAIDAAVAAAFALGVCEPQASGLGGQSMLVAHLPEERRTLALDGSSRAPNRATAEEFEHKRDLLRGYLATTVPTTPALLAWAAQQYGRLPLARLIEPAIRLAEEGYAISQLQRRLQVREARHWADGNAAAFFLDGGEPFEVGATFKQPTLARTLRRIAEHGVEDFYQGEIAEHIVSDMAANGGLIQHDDLARIPWPVERRPVSVRFEELRVLTMPPPGAGRTVVEMFNILSNFTDKQRDLDSPAGIQLFAEVCRRAQYDRSDRPFDPNLYPQVDDRQMTSADYAKQVAKQIKRRLNPKKGVKGAKPASEESATTPALEDEAKGDTTHLSVMDREGMIVGLTQSIERVYGSFCASPELGFLYNNYMSAFALEDFAHPYYLRPNGPPWASVAPSIVFRGRKPWVVLGSPGSQRIASAVVQVLLRMRSSSPLSAVIAPRLHCSEAGVLSLEGAWIRDDAAARLKRRGFLLDVREPMSFFLGCVQLVAREGDTFIAVADPRRDGSASALRK
jgi:gamma-glutamyltranspeptidase/glutathione hydrolase